MGGHGDGRDASPQYQGSSPCRGYPESTFHRDHCCGQGSSWVPRRSDTPCECGAISRCCSTALRGSIQLHQAPNKRNRTSRCLSPQRLGALCTCPSWDYGCSSISGPPGLADPRGSIVSPAHAVSPTGAALAVQHPALPWPPASGKVTVSTAKATGHNQGHALLAILILFF